jgi:hypothetical protein
MSESRQTPAATDAADLDRFRRLLLARSTGAALPADLAAWLTELLPHLAAIAGRGVRTTPAERARLRLGAELDRWMGRRGVTPRTIAAPRRTVQRVLGGGNVTVDAIADIADALGCELAIRFDSRENP